MYINENKSTFMKEGALGAMVSILGMIVLFKGWQSLKVARLVEWQLISTNGINLTIQAFLDSTSAMFAGVVMLISLSVLLFTTSYMKGDPNIVYFLIVVGIFVGSMMKLIMCPHMINLMAGWDGLGLSSYLLVIYYMNDKSMAAGMLTLMTNRIGDALLIVACALSFSAGQWNFVQNNFKVTGLIMLLLMVAAMTKSAQMPFSAWLPAAMAAPTPVSALVHSSTLVTAGIYLLIRFYSSLTQYVYFQNMILLIGVATCLMASMSATCETDLKKIIALSTLSQLGVMMMAIGLGQPKIAFFHLVTHALFKALLFICAGNIIHSMQDNQDIRLMGNIAASMPATTTTLNMANLSLCGFPFMAGFYSKDAIVESLMMSNAPLSTSMLLMVSITMTSAYTVRLSILTLWSPFKGSPMKTSNDENVLIYTAYGILLVGAIAGGALGYWIYLPVVQPMIMPTLMKISTLTMVTCFALIMWYYVVNDKTITGTHFMSSMWFLTFITSSPIVKSGLSISKTVNYNEATWMEKISGKGALKAVSSTVKVLQKSGNMTLSEMLSLFSALWFILMVMYFVY